MIIKSKSLQDNMNTLPSSITKNAISFSDFQQLKLGGCQRILTFGEYSNKKNHTKINKRKVIMYFYKNIKM